MNGSGFGWNLWLKSGFYRLGIRKTKFFIGIKSRALADPPLSTYLSPKMFPNRENALLDVRRRPELESSEFMDFHLATREESSQTCRRRFASICMLTNCLMEMFDRWWNLRFLLCRWPICILKSKNFHASHYRLINESASERLSIQRWEL